MFTVGKELSDNSEQRNPLGKEEKRRSTGNNTFYTCSSAESKCVLSTPSYPSKALEMGVCFHSSPILENMGVKLLSWGLREKGEIYFC
jgi:hypothetical protein